MECGTGGRPSFPLSRTRLTPAPVLSGSLPPVGGPLARLVSPYGLGGRNVLTNAPIGPHEPPHQLTRAGTGAGTGFEPSVTSHRVLCVTMSRGWTGMLLCSLISSCEFDERQEFKQPAEHIEQTVPEDPDTLAFMDSLRTWFASTDTGLQKLTYFQNGHIVGSVFGQGVWLDLAC